MIEFAAVIGFTGTPSRGGWYLAPLAPGQPVPTVKPLPLPLFGEQQPDDSRIGWVDHLALLRSAVVARGFIDNTPSGRDYAGALRLGLTRMVMEGETTDWAHDEHGDEMAPVCCMDWRIAGASVQQAPAWDLPRPQIEIRGMV